LYTDLDQFVFSQYFILARVRKMIKEKLKPFGPKFYMSEQAHKNLNRS